MKEIASSIVMVAAVLMLISAEHFGSLLFWGIGIIMLIDGAMLFVASTLFPNKLSVWLERLSLSTASNSRIGQ